EHVAVGIADHARGLIASDGFGDGRRCGLPLVRALRADIHQSVLVGEIGIALGAGWQCGHFDPQDFARPLAWALTLSRRFCASPSERRYLESTLRYADQSGKCDFL